MSVSDNKIIAWKIIHELMQRSTEPLSLKSLHPGGGQYDCLAIFRCFNEELQMLINLNGASIMDGAFKEITHSYPEDYKQNKEDLINKISNACKCNLAEKPVRNPAVIEFFIGLIEQGIDVTSAWLDSSNDNCLSDEARIFPFYPLRDVSNLKMHWSWWIIRQEGNTIAICNIYTCELILSSGNRYKVDDIKKALQICNVQYMGKLNEWSMAVSDTQALLVANDEWRERYAEYARLIHANLLNITAVRKTFREWDPLKLYLNVTNAKNAKNAVPFELRYLGQAVSLLKGANNLKLNTAKYDITNIRDFDCKLTLTDIDWVSPAASAFRRYFKDLASNGRLMNPGNEEHRVESLLLTEMLKTKNKVLPYMKPVTIGGIRFPMPTPLKASDHQTVGYARQFGGGIDIFARTGTGGKNTNLCVIEVKDENTKHEPPKDAIKQALAYTTFIRELLRSDAGDAWWKLFGFSGKIPADLTLFAVCAMPSNANDDTSFRTEEIPLVGKDKAILHYIYFTESNNTIIKAESSLFD